MSNRPITRRIILLLAAFVLQATIPVGYMPGSIIDGRFVEFCPAGVSTEFMAAIAGHAADAHQHSENDSEFVQCDLSGGPGAAIVHNEQPDNAAFKTLVALRPVSQRLAATTNRGIGYQPRSPPVS